MPESSYMQYSVDHTIVRQAERHLWPEKVYHLQLASLWTRLSPRVRVSQYVLLDTSTEFEY